MPLEESGGGTEHTSPIEGASHKVIGPCSEVKINAGTEKGKSGEKTPRECKVEVNVIQDSGPDSFPLLYRNKVNQKNDKSENSVKVISNETPITQDRKCTSDSEDGEGEEGLAQAETIGKVLVKKMKNGKKRKRKAASISDKRQTSVKSCGVNNPDIVATDEQDTKQESRKERDARKKANAREKAGNLTENQPLLRKRRMRKSDGEFSCDKCGRTFNRKCHFTSHLKTHTRHNLQCHRCLTVCSDNVEYVKHGEKCKLKTRTKRKSVKDCEICGKVLTSAEGMALHLNAHKKESHHICRFCGKGIKTKYFLIVHERIHTGERPFSCEQCGNSFKDKGTLTVHMRIHTGEKPFTCEYCGKSFRFKNVLRRHERLHTGKKDFQCEICGLFFQQKKSLQIHKMKHTGERPFPCETCEKAFKTSYDLKNHMMTHIVGEKPHRCNICEKGFQHSSSLRKHKKIKHNNPEGILCHMCAEKFAYNWQLLKHIEKKHRPKIPIEKKHRPKIPIEKKHSPKTPKRERKPYIRNPNPSKEFPCTVCSKRFSAKRTLLRHMHVHASNPKYQCKFCGRTFAGKWNVKKHIENKHSTPISFDSQQEV
ncbi:zinc finger protein 260-like [Ptychodera flava]|uniref:zinc finger protein 260-like n=1 Tax=Ptychodera flava TaxID=63121 RepID=UPI00396A453E